EPGEFSHSNILGHLCGSSFIKWVGDSAARWGALHRLVQAADEVVEFGRIAFPLLHKCRWLPAPHYGSARLGFFGNGLSGGYGFVSDGVRKRIVASPFAACG